MQIGLFAVYWTWQRLHGRPFPLRRKPVGAALAALFLGVGPIVILFYKLRYNGAGSVTVPKAGDFLSLVRCWNTGPMSAFPAYKIPWRMYDVSTAVMVGCAVLGVRQLWRRDEFQHWILYFAAALIAAPPALVFAYSTLLKHPLGLRSGASNQNTLGNYCASRDRRHRLERKFLRPAMNRNSGLFPIFTLLATPPKSGQIAAIGRTACWRRRFGYSNSHAGIPSTGSSQSQLRYFDSTAGPLRPATGTSTWTSARSSANATSRVLPI